jgi:tetratricopeptide (TPR) repeat protein
MFPMAEGELSEKDHARATTLLAEVNEATESGNDEETLNKLLELYEMMPTSTEILFNIASTYESMGDTENALEYYTQAAEKNPDLAYDSWLAIGDIHGKARQWADAAAAMKKAMDIKQIDAVAMFNYAVYAQNAGDPDAASVAFEKTIEIDPNRAVAYYQLGLIAVGKAENEVALTNFEKFIALAPDHDRVDEAQGVIDALKAAEERAK